jgi:SAM-dependent methyltransferase
MTKPKSSPTTPAAELERLRAEYAAREQRLAGSDRYSLYSPGDLFIWQGRQRALLALLRRWGYEPLSRYQILEVGCGQGGVLHELLSYGASPARLFGCDLLLERLLGAHQTLPHLPLTCADGQFLPYPDAAFDLVLQFTVFSSILDDEIKRCLAQEMLRVLSPGGMILWYDFWINPLNRQTRGIQPREIRQIFPGCQFRFCRITLAPPLARRLAPLSWQACALLEKLQFFNTHYLVAIRRIV